MINKKKKEKVITEEKTECACPMIDAIAMITARDFDESGVFDPDSPQAEMETSGELLSVAAAGYTDEKGKFYLDRFFEYSDIYETYEIGKQLFADTEDDDGEDDSDM